MWSDIAHCFMVSRLKSRAMTVSPAKGLLSGGREVSPKIRSAGRPEHCTNGQTHRAAPGKRLEVMGKRLEEPCIRHTASRPIRIPPLAAAPTGGRGHKAAGIAGNAGDAGFAGFQNWIIVKSDHIITKIDLTSCKSSVASHWPRG